MITNELNIGLIEAAKEKMPTGTNLANTLMDMATSITAPRQEIRRPEKSKPPTWIRLVFQRVIRVSISETLYPEIPDALLKHQAETPARITPTRVPSVAAQVFRVGPPIRYIVTSVVIKHTNTAVQKGEYFRYTRGRYTKITQKNVKTSPRHPFIPCFPPIRQRTNR